MRKIKVVAIAKNESPYLAEWIYHHLYFGFDSIKVYVNRSSDLSSAILEEICVRDTRVSWDYGDWVDYLADGIRSHLQQILYASAYKEAVDEGFTHVLFIDVDEFWFPLDFSSSIHSFLNRFEGMASVSFQWFCELGSGEVSFRELPSEIRGVNSLNVKTAINVAAGIRRIGIHIPIFENGAHHYFSDGVQFVRDKKNIELSSHEYLGLKNAVVIHRMYRSRLEYLASLIRGNPEDPNSWKSNRGAYITRSDSEQVIKIDPSTWKVYNSGYHSFVDDFSLVELIKQSQSIILKNAAAAIKHLKEKQPNSSLLKE